MTKTLKKSPCKNALDAGTLLSRVMETERCITTMRQLNALWPHAESMCLHLCEYILTVIPDPDGEKPLINHCIATARTVVKHSLAKWRNQEITDVAVFNDLKTALIEAAALAAYWKVSLTRDRQISWSPLSEQCLLHWWENHQEELSITPNTAIDAYEQQQLFSRIETLLVQDLVEDQLKIQQTNAGHA